MKKSLYILSASLLAIFTAACSSEAENQIQTYSPATVTIQVPDALSFADGETSVELDIQSTTTWSIKDLPKWLKASMSGGSNDQTITFTAESNTSCLNQRTDSFHVTAAELSRTVIVTQEPSSLSSTASLTFDANGSSAELKVKSTTDWELELPDWLKATATEGSGNQTITITAENNPSCLTKRTDFVLVTAEDSIITVSATQNAHTFNVPESLDLDVDVTTAAYKIESTTSWEITELPAWLKTTITEGTGNQTVPFTAEVNPTCKEKRTGTFTVTALDASVTVNVTQEAATEYFTIPEEKPEEFTSDGGKYTFTVNSNSIWSITGAESWTTLSATSGSGSLQITLTVSANTLEEARSASIKVSTDTQSKTITLNIKQAALVKPIPGDGDNFTPDL